MNMCPLSVLGVLGVSVLGVSVVISCECVRCTYECYWCEAPNTVSG